MPQQETVRFCYTKCCFNGLDHFNTPDVSWLSLDSWPAEQLFGLVVGLQHPNVSGKIVFIPNLHWGYEYAEARRRGAIAIILTSYVFEAGILNYARYTNLNEPMRLLKPALPTVEGSGDEFKESFYLLGYATNGTFLEFPCTLSRQDPNPWKGVAFYGSLFISLGIGFLCLLALFMACYKIYITAKSEEGLRLTIKLGCLYIEVFANTLRSIFIIIDPIFMRRIFPVTVYSFMYLGLVSLSLATTVLIAFYWHEWLLSIRPSKYQLNKFLIPSIIVVTILVLLDMTNGILWSAGKSLTLIKACYLGLFIASFASGLYLLITGSVVLRGLYKGRDSFVVKAKIKITILILLSAIFIFLSSITSVISMFGIFTSPAGFISLYIAHWVPLVMISITQISAIVPKQQEIMEGASSIDYGTRSQTSSVNLE